MLRIMARKHGLQLDVRSAGVSAYNDSPISENSTQILREKGFVEKLKSSALTADMVSWADLILTMTESHKSHAAQKHPEAIDKLYTLKEFAVGDTSVQGHMEELDSLVAELQVKQALSQPISDRERRQLAALQQRIPDFDIVDPYGGSIADYRRCAEEIEQCLEQLVQKLKNIS
jgi:protein-tyrosine phosphatase